jgi:hypothetical protein
MNGEPLEMGRSAAQIASDQLQRRRKEHAKVEAMLKWAGRLIVVFRRI